MMCLRLWNLLLLARMVVLKMFGLFCFLWVWPVLNDAVYCICLLHAL